jgi:hypothetical protein
VEERHCRSTALPRRLATGTGASPTHFGRKGMLPFSQIVIREHNTKRGSPMTTLVQQIEEMCFKVNELTSGEHKLLNALSDALTRSDYQLVHDVRAVAGEHERRRGLILQELQALAICIGTLPGQRDPVAALEETPDDPFPLASLYGEDQGISGADWRQAASNIEDELDSQFARRMRTH